MRLRLRDPLLMAKPTHTQKAAALPGLTADAFVRLKIVEEISKVLKTLIAGGSATAKAVYCSHIIHDLAGKVPRQISALVCLVNYQ